MTSLIFQTTVRLLHPLLLLYALFLVIRGHDQPGGGFTGGLVATVSFVLLSAAYDTREARRVMRIEPQTLVGSGLLLSFVAGLVPVAMGRPFLTGAWASFPLPGLGTVELGTPYLFEAGVFLTVVGSACLVLFTLSET